MKNMKQSNWETNHLNCFTKNIYMNDSLESTTVTKSLAPDIGQANKEC